MDRVKLGKAAKLLAKAEVTTFEHEATALAERAHRMVSDVLNATEGEDQGRGILQRRERRSLKERRSLWERRAGQRVDRRVGGHENPNDPASSYRLRSGQPSPPSGGHPPGNIDLTA